MKKKDHKNKSSDKTKTRKNKDSKRKKFKSFKNKSGELKIKNKNDVKNDKDSKVKNKIKVKKTSKLKESKLEFKKRLNRLYSILLLNHNDPSKTKEVIDSLIKELPTNFCEESNKRNISRILQACLKYGDSSVRSSIFENVKERLNILNLNCRSSKFFIKLFHYCNVDTKKFLKESFFNPKQKNLLFSRFSSDVMDIIYIKLRPKEQIAVLNLYCLSNSFYLNNDDTRRSREINSINQLITLISSSSSKDSCLEKMQSVITKLVEKELMISCISHDILFVYVNLLKDKTELMSEIYKIYGQLLSSRNGNNALITLVEYANNKMKKFIVKSLKRDFPDAVYNQINVNFLIKILNLTDDTKLTGEYLIEPLLENLEKVVFDKYSSKFVMNVLDTDYTTESQTSLKDPKTRKEELQSKLVPSIVEYFKGSDLKAILLDKNAQPVLLHTLKVSKDQTLLQSLLELLKENFDVFLENMVTLRFYQSLVKSSNKVGQQLLELGVNELLWELLKHNSSKMISSKSIFLLVDLLESFYKQEKQKFVEDFKSRISLDLVEKEKKKLQEVNSTGINLLLNLLKE